MACYKLTTERVVIPESKEKQSNLGITFKGLLKNKPLISILTASLIYMMCSMLLGAVNVYLFKDYFGSAAALSIIGFIQTAAVFIAIPLAKPLVAKYGKKEIASVGMLLAGIVYAFLFFSPNLTSTQFIIVSAFGMFGYAFFNIVVWAFVTDVIDYHEYLTGLREDGTVYSIYSFARKVGQAIAGGIGGFAIAAVGYDATREIQTHDALHGIHTLATLVPALVFLLVFIILAFLYPLTKQRTNQLSIDLTNKRNNRNEII